MPLRQIPLIALLSLAGLAWFFCAPSKPATDDPPRPKSNVGSDATLAEKAEYCEEDIFANHLQEGLLIGPRVDPKGERLHSAENSGLRTGCLLSAMAYKFSVTRDERTRQRAGLLLGSLELLEKVTGVPGLTARHYMRMNSPGPDEAGSWLAKHWHQAGPHRWVGDVSTDEMTFYLTGLGNYILLCGEHEKRERAAALVRRVVGRLLDHDMRITNADGSATFYGDCSRQTPLEPLFCLHGLHYLKAAALLTSDKRLARAYKEYVGDEDYFRKAVHGYKGTLASIQWATWDWQLAAASYEFLIRHDPGRSQQFKQGLLEMAGAPDATVFPHLCTALFGLGGGTQVTRWLEDFNPQNADGVGKGWYLWIYWKARSANIVTPQR